MSVHLTEAAARQVQKQLEKRGGGPSFAGVTDPVPIQEGGRIQRAYDEERCAPHRGDQPEDPTEGQPPDCPKPADEHRKREGPQREGRRQDGVGHDAQGPGDVSRPAEELGVQVDQQGRDHHEGTEGLDRQAVGR